MERITMLCSVCHKNMAIIFTKKVDGDKSEMEGLCYNCAKEKGINPLEIFILYSILKYLMKIKKIFFLQFFKGI